MAQEWVGWPEWAPSGLGKSWVSLKDLERERLIGSLITKHSVYQSGVKEWDDEKTPLERGVSFS